MSGPPRHVVPPANAAGEPPSLWREVVDGSAGPVVRVGVSAALAAAFAAAALLGSYPVAAWVPSWAQSYGRFGPSDELVAAMLALAGFGYLGCLTWLWTRSRNRVRHIQRAVFQTLMVALATLIVSFALVTNLVSGVAEEYVLAGVVCGGGAVAFLIWVEAGRRHVRGKPMHNPVDGVLDVHCPGCGYRMVGLHESRCPECGTLYTLDELLGRQEFRVNAPRVGATAPAATAPVPVPTDIASSNGAPAA